MVRSMPSRPGIRERREQGVGKGQSITIAEEEEPVITRRTAVRQYCGDRLRRVTRHVTSTIVRSSDMACRATPPVVTVTRCQLLGATGSAAADRRVMLTVHAVDRSYNRLLVTGGCWFTPQSSRRQVLA